VIDGFLPNRFPVDDPEAVAAGEVAFGQLATSVRRLLDLTVRTSVSNEEALAVAAVVDQLADRLAVSAKEGPRGLEVGSDGRLRNHGNPAIGLRNPIAPGVSLTHGDQSAHLAVTLGAPYEGPPGNVHGGVIALLLDQLLGSVAAWASRPGMTAYLNLTYRRPTPLGPISGEARVAEISGRKTVVVGELRNAAGETTVEAEALFVVPQAWLDRQKPAEPAGDAVEVPDSE
jgi:acyl-coenzyme A thioesterase PaaI-like protein